MKSINHEDDRLKGAVIVASVSGGKDSAAMSLVLTANGLDHHRVFANTGWEHDDTYTYLRGALAEKIGPIVEVQGKYGGMAALVKSKGAFPSRMRRFCTDQLKMVPLRDYVLDLQAKGHDVVNAVGVRAGESRARAKFPEWEWNNAFDCWVWRPILSWSEQDVIDAHKECGLVPNPLYLRGARRVGCWPCIMSNKDEIRMIAEMTPERIDEIRELEFIVGNMAEARAESKGTTLAEKGHRRPTFFHGHGKTMMPPIDDVVAWSRTDRGGRQFPLLPQTGDAGCVRWGMCEHLEEEEDDQ